MKTGAAYLRVDTIEQAIVRFVSSGQELRDAVTRGLGYDVAQAVARDLLRQGSHVFAECVNPMKITRDAWRDVSEAAGARLVVPTWADILAREYEPWDRSHLVLDTAGQPAEVTIAALLEALDVKSRLDDGGNG